MADVYDFKPEDVVPILDVGKTFKNETVCLDGREFYGCTFYNCRLRGTPRVMINCVLYSCDRGLDWSSEDTGCVGFANESAGMRTGDIDFRLGMSFEEVQTAARETLGEEWDGVDLREPDSDMPVIVDG